jgi:hypothetical protein
MLDDLKPLLLFHMLELLNFELVGPHISGALASRVYLGLSRAYISMKIFKHVFVFTFDHRSSWSVVNWNNHADGLCAIKSMVLVLNQALERLL